MSSGVIFKGRAWFQSASFGGFNYFAGCEFWGEADFSTRETLSGEKPKSDFLHEDFTSNKFAKNFNNLSKGVSKRKGHP
jgi:hypothetical protein